MAFPAKDDSVHHGRHGARRKESQKQLTSIFVSVSLSQAEEINLY